MEYQLEEKKGKEDIQKMGERYYKKRKGKISGEEELYYIEIYYIYREKAKRKKESKRKETEKAEEGSEYMEVYK